MRVEDWLTVTPNGLFCRPGRFYIDPVRPVDRAAITHGHADHARAGHGHVLATPETLAIMVARYGAEMASATQPAPYGQPVRIDDVTLTLRPAGHVLGSAQIVLEHQDQRAVISGDYKRRADPTCPPFEPVSCDVFVTEATFALPVFRHPDDRGEVAKLLASLRLSPDRAHLVGVYGLGKCQRLICLLRAAGWDGPIYLHGALVGLCALYERLGIALGDLRPVSEVARKADLAGQIILAPPAATADRWSRRMPDPVVAMASGWMQVRARARQRGVELPLILSDHADWDELNQTLDDVRAGEVWVTHGREEALIHAARQRGLAARALALVGFEEEGQ